MIFDFYLKIDLKAQSDLHPRLFSKESLYSDIVGNEIVQYIPKGFVTFLSRGDYRECYKNSENIRLWIFGYVFSSNKYSEKFNKPVSKINAEKLLELVKFYPNEYLDFIKGSFVLVFYHDESQKVEVITDKLNVLPLYFAFHDNYLVISSNTSMMMKEEWINKEPDSLALCMQAFFDYMLGEYYFIKGIRRFENARIYSFLRGEIKCVQYWDVKELYHKKLLGKKESLDLLAEQLKANVDLYSAQSKNLLVSLTGGFDGRTNLAMLNKNHNDFLCYSYGMPGSLQIRVPQSIALKTGIKYKPVFLDQNFLNKYYENSIKASYFSNGTAPIGFCNIPYAYSELSKFSDSVLTGLFGSEILRPLHNNGIQVNDQSFNIFLANEPENAIKDISKKLYTLKYLNISDIDVIIEQLNEYIINEFFEKYKDFEKITRFFFFIIQEGIRKYFSQEISIERVYVTTYYPYFDFDLVNLIYKTPWAGMYNGFLGKSKFKRRKGQLLYAYIIKKYYPELGKIKFDRGYTSNDLLLPFPINYLKISIGVYKTKRYLKMHDNNDTFKTEKWSIETISNILNKRLTENSDFFTSLLYDDFKSRKYLKNLLTYRHFISLLAFLQINKLN